MTLNKQKGNMYPWVDFTWNPIRGRCPHQCIYCYYQADPRYKDLIGELRLDEKALKDNLGEGRTVFVGSSTDMWTKMIYGSWDEWISKVLLHCNKYPKNKYLFQTKAISSLLNFQSFLPPDVIIGTTAETNRPTNRISKASLPFWRLSGLRQLSLPKMISIEPIIDFDLNMFVYLIEKANPQFVSIGADSKGHNLPEPPGSKIKELIVELEKFTEVKIKNNLSRLLR